MLLGKLCRDARGALFTASETDARGRAGDVALGAFGEADVWLAEAEAAVTPVVGFE